MGETLWVLGIMSLVFGVVILLLTIPTTILGLWGTATEWIGERFVGGLGVALGLAVIVVLELLIGAVLVIAGFVMMAVR